MSANDKIVGEDAEDVLMTNAVVSIKKRKKLPSSHKGHEITSTTIKTPQWSYLHLSLMTDSSAKPVLDNLSVKKYLTTAFSHFLGMTGASIAVDILKVEGDECWIRVPREDASAVKAAVGSWIGGNEKVGSLGWKIKGAGNWLGSLAARCGIEKVWSG